MKTFSEIYNEWHHLDKVDLARKVYEECKAGAGSDGYAVVPKEPSAEIVNHGHAVFLGHFNEGGQTGGRSLYYAYKAMIEAEALK